MIGLCCPVFLHSVAWRRILPFSNASAASSLRIGQQGPFTIFVVSCACVLGWMSHCSYSLFAISCAVARMNDTCSYFFQTVCSSFFNGIFTCLNIQITQFDYSMNALFYHAVQHLTLSTLWICHWACVFARLLCNTQHWCHPKEQLTSGGQHTQVFKWK